MSRRTTALFAGLIAAQAMHSIEEYVGRLWEVLPPARMLSGLVSDNLERGFVTINLAVVTFGVLCLVGPVRGGWRSAPTVIWWWAALETMNGIVHVGIAVWQGGYAPGVATAPLLIALGVTLLSCGAATRA